MYLFIYFKNKQETSCKERSTTEESAATDGEKDKSKAMLENEEDVSKQAAISDKQNDEEKKGNERKRGKGIFDDIYQLFKFTKKPT